MTAQTLTLTQFLLDRIAEDEAPSWELVPRPRWMGGPVGFVGHHCFICEETSHGGTPEAMTEAAQDHDEKIHRRSRVLAECAAKRRIVAMWHEVVIDDDGSDDSEEVLRHPTDESHTGWVLALWDTLRALASVYADHPLYDEGWAL